MADVFHASTGVGRGAWRALRLLYHASARSRIASAIYSRLRAHADLNRQTLALHLLGRSLRRRSGDEARALVVAHPILAAIFREQRNLVYQHGEVIVPRESLVQGRHRVIVPLAETADVFLAAGVERQHLFVSGLCIERALVGQAKARFAASLARLTGSGPLCGAFFSSGAEPRAHVETLCIAARSAVAAGGRVIVFARESGRLAERFARRFAVEKIEVEVTSTSGELPVGKPQALLCLYDSRRKLNELTACLFRDFDYFVAPAHERTHWPLGLGLPMWIVDPSIGPSSPLNRAFLLRHSVASVLRDSRDARQFGDLSGDERRSGALSAKAEAGWGRYQVDGFFNIAAMLQSL